MDLVEGRFRDPEIKRSLTQELNYDPVSLRYYTRRSMPALVPILVIREVERVDESVCNYSFSANFSHLVSPDYWLALMLS